MQQLNLSGTHTQHLSNAMREITHAIIINNFGIKDLKKNSLAGKNTRRLRRGLMKHFKSAKNACISTSKVKINVIVTREFNTNLKVYTAMKPLVID